MQKRDFGQLGPMSRYLDTNHMAVSAMGDAGGRLRKLFALALSTLLALLGLAGVGHAESVVAVQGTIEAVDCQAGTLVLSGPGGSNTFTVGGYTAVLINSTSVPFCTLAAYIGMPATVWLTPSGNQFTATRIDVTGQPTAAPPAGATTEVSPVPIWGVVLGTIVVAGLVYLLVRGPDGGYYRYPYYGEYYRYYYHPEYRPYIGFYPATAPVITVASVIIGTVLGIVVIDNLQYILSRDAAGHLYRYPYYGPYRQVYYRPAYRPYQGPYVTTGAYRNAPIRQGDPRWDAPARPIRPAPGAPGRPGPAPAPLRPAPGPQPVPVRPPAPIPIPAPPYQPPAPQRPPTPPYQPPAPQRPPTPPYQPPAPPRPPAPAYQPPVPQRPGVQPCGGPNQPPCPGAPGAPSPAPQRPPKR